MTTPTIQALVYTGYGGPEVVDKIALPFPQQKSNEIVVKVVYSGSRATLDVTVVVTQHRLMMYLAGRLRGYQHR